MLAKACLPPKKRKTSRVPLASCIVVRPTIVSRPWFNTGSNETSSRNGHSEYNRPRAQSCFETYIVQTITVMTTFILAMLLHPESYQKAQQEMDEVVGSDRLPEFEDKPQLPYLDCVLKEVLR